MGPSEFTANYEHLGDEKLLYLWADRTSLVPEAAVALDSELQRRGLNKENAVRVKKRLDALAAREEKGPLLNQVAAARYERNMRHFVGWQEPKFDSRYAGWDIRRKMFARTRHKYRVWKAFRDHTGHWPILSIWFHFLSWIAVIGFVLSAFVWLEERKRDGGWSFIAVIGCVLAVLGARDFGARLMRKLDWKKYGT